MYDTGHFGRVPFVLVPLLASVPMVLAQADQLSGHAPAAALVYAPADEQSFLAENDAAMAKMMDGMAVKPTGDVDRDFVNMRRERASPRTGCDGARGPEKRKHLPTCHHP